MIINIVMQLHDHYKYIHTIENVGKKVMVFRTLISGFGFEL